MSNQEFLAEGAEIEEVQVPEVPESEEVPEEEVPEENTEEESETEETKPEDPVSILTAQVQAYEEIFASPEDAADAVEKVNYYNEFSSAVLAGRADIFLGEIVKADPEGASEFSRNFLPVLSKANPDLYTEITLPVVKNLLRNALRSSDEQLQRAAKKFSHVLFNSVDVPDDIQRVQNPAKRELEEERNQIRTEREQDFGKKLIFQTTQTLDTVINEGLDPNGVMTEITKDALVGRIKSKISEVLRTDRPFQTKMASLLEKAKDSRYSSEFIQKMHELYSAKIKAITPGIRQEERKKAIKIVPKKPENQLKRAPGTQGVRMSREIDWKRTKQEDYMSDNTAKIFYKEAK